jgi:hypothetical protein
VGLAALLSFERPTLEPGLAAFVWEVVMVMVGALVAGAIASLVLKDFARDELEASPSQHPGTADAGPSRSSRLAHLILRPFAGLMVLLFVLTLVAVNSPLGPVQALCGPPLQTPGEPLGSQCIALGLFGVEIVGFASAVATVSWTQRWKWPIVFLAIGLSALGVGLAIFGQVYEEYFQESAFVILAFFLFLMAGIVLTFVAVFAMVFGYDVEERRVQDWFGSPSGAKENRRSVRNRYRPSIRVTVAIALIVALLLVVSAATSMAVSSYLGWSNTTPPLVSWRGNNEDSNHLPALAWASYATTPAGDTLIFGGCLSVSPCVASNQTWFSDVDQPYSWDYVVHPSARYGAAMAPLPDGKGDLLFGGFSASGRPLGDTWLFGINSWYGSDYWDNLTGSLAISPPARGGASMEFDPGIGTNGSDVLFGGCGTPVCPLGDTWIFNGTAWEQAPVNYSGERHLLLRRT